MAAVNIASLLPAAQRIFAAAHGASLGGGSRWVVAAAVAAAARGTEGAEKDQLSQEVERREQLARRELAARVQAGHEGKAPESSGGTRALRHVAWHCHLGQPEALERVALQPQAAQRGGRRGRRRLAAAADQAGENMEEHPGGTESVEGEAIVQREVVEPDAEKEKTAQTAARQAAQNTGREGR